MDEVGNVPGKKCGRCSMNIPKESKVCPFCGAKVGSIPLVPIVIGLVLLLVIGLLASTNPDERAFEEYVSRRVNARLSGKGGNIFEQFLGQAAGMTASKMTHRSNYVLFSVFEFETAFLRLFKPDFPKVRFLGIAGQIIPLSKVNLDELASPSQGAGSPPPAPIQQGGTDNLPAPGTSPQPPSAETQPASPPPAQPSTPPAPQGQAPTAVQPAPAPPPPAQDGAEARRQKQADYQRNFDEHMRKLRDAGRSR